MEVWCAVRDECSRLADLASFSALVRFVGSDTKFKVLITLDPIGVKIDDFRTFCPLSAKNHDFTEVAPTSKSP